MENRELLEKAKAAKSAEELRAIAKENEVDLTEEDAAAYFSQLHKSGELSDEELDAVAGGGCHVKDGRLIVSEGYSCDGWACAACGKTNRGRDGHGCRTRYSPINIHCPSCKYRTYEQGLWLCNNPINIK